MEAKEPKRETMQGYIDIGPSITNYANFTQSISFFVDRPLSVMENLVRMIQATYLYKQKALLE